MKMLQNLRMNLNENSKDASLPEEPELAIDSVEQTLDEGTDYDRALKALNTQKQRMKESMTRTYDARGMPLQKGISETSQPVLQLNTLQDQN